MVIGAHHLDHTKEDRLLLEVVVILTVSKRKSCQRVHSNGNQLQIIPLLMSMDMVVLSKLIYFQFPKNLKINNFSISHYSTASTNDAVYVIGGWSSIDGGVGEKVKRIAEFKEGRWTIIGEMEKPRRYHGSISFGGKTLIFDDDDDTVEIWNLERKQKLSTFNAPDDPLWSGFGMFTVNKDFCKQN